MSELSKCEMAEAVSDGVERAITKMINGMTSSPSTLFWETLGNAIERAFILNLMETGPAEMLEFHSNIMEWKTASQVIAEAQQGQVNPS